MQRNRRSVRANVFPALLFASLTVGVVPAIAGSSAKSPAGSRPLTTGSYSDSVSGGPVLGASNTNGNNPFNDYGIEGIVPNDTGGVGVLGYGQQAKSYGIYGVSFGSNGIGVYGAGDGPTPAPGATPSSATQSTGVVGDSHSGYGVYGSTEFPNSSDPVNGIIAAGVYGADLSAKSNSNAGVAGVSGNGFGVIGLGSRSAAGVAGISDNEVGVVGQSMQDYGMYGNSAQSIGGVFSSSAVDGVLALAGTGTGAAAVEARGAAAGYGVLASNAAGIALYANTGTGTGVYATTGSGVALSIGGGTGSGIRESSSGGTSGFFENSNGDGLFVEASGKGVASQVEATGLGFIAYDYNGNELFEVDGHGNVRYHGTLTAFARTRDGYSAESYGARTSRPTIEDSGTGRLVNGQAMVALDPALVEQMDLSSKYRVFLTPDGDTNGLYVQAKTPQGFVVREIHGGRGTLDFDYRILAVADGQGGRRMTLTRASEAEAMQPHVPALDYKRLGTLPRHVAVAPIAVSTLLGKRIGGVRRAYVPQPNLTIEHREPALVK